MTKKYDAIIQNYTTEVLVDELMRRQGVETYEIGPYDDMFTTDGNLNIKGPAVVLVVYD